MRDRAKGHRLGNNVSHKVRWSNFHTLGHGVAEVDRARTTQISILVEPRTKPNKPNESTKPNASPSRS